MLEIRGHARGGQGMVTAFEILAKIFSRLDHFQVQAFPAFGVERSGAPIQAFLRVSREKILNRSNIYHPDLVVVFDESLLAQVSVFSGLRETGAVLLNTERLPEDFPGVAEQVFTIPATSISTQLGLGSRSLPIVNAAMIGAILRIFGADLSAAEAILRAGVPVNPEANAEAARRAYQRVRSLADEEALLKQVVGAGGSLRVGDAVFGTVPKGLEMPCWSEPLSSNKTGNWRVMTPEFVGRAAPCSVSCPAGTDVRTVIKLVSRGKYEEARDVIYRHNPFPAICGRICPHFCEQRCNRAAFDEGLDIGAVERFLGDLPEAAARPSPIRHPEKIAVIGSGPAGLTAGLRLREKGYEVTLFETLAQAGGMLRSGIPRFRLPDAILDRDIARIEAGGVSIRLKRRVKVEEVAGAYDAVITAVGSHVGRSLKLDNESLLTDGLGFLQRFKLGGDDGGLKPGDEVAIIGGGNTAVDVARTTLRLGAVPVIYYRRRRRDMPAIAGEVEAAVREGVQIEYLRAPVAVEPARKGRIKLFMQEMRPGEPDESGRRRPMPVPGSVRAVVVDMAVVAIGQRADDFAFSKRPVPKYQGRIDYPASIPVFAAGDMAWGGTVAEAIGSGNQVAEEVHAFLRGRSWEGASLSTEVVRPEAMNFYHYRRQSRRKAEIHDPGRSFRDFTEVVAGLDEKEVKAETARCLHCGDCYSCGNCFNFCPEAAVFIDESGDLHIDYDYCKGCGICAAECPCGAIQYVGN